MWHLHSKKFDNTPSEELLAYIREGTDDRLFAIAELIRRGADLGLIYNATRIDLLFLEKMRNIVQFETVIAAHPLDPTVLRDAKRMGISDRYLAERWGKTEGEIFELRRRLGVLPVYKMIDTCASEFESYVPYFYSTYETENESVASDRKKDPRPRQRPDPDRTGGGVRLLHRPRDLGDPAGRV